MTLANLAMVDAIVLFEEDTPYKLIKRIVPNVLVKGSDYLVKEIVGHDIVLGNGGSVITIEFIDGYSTTSIIEKNAKWARLKQLFFCQNCGLLAHNGWSKCVICKQWNTIVEEVVA